MSPWLTLCWVMDCTKWPAVLCWVMDQVACCAVQIRSSVICNFKNEDLFLENEGIFLLLDLLEV